MTHFTLISFTTGTKSHYKIDPLLFGRDIFHSDDLKSTAQHLAMITSKFGKNQKYLETIILINGIDAFLNEDYPEEAALVATVFQLSKTFEQ